MGKIALFSVNGHVTDRDRDEVPEDGVAGCGLPGQGIAEGEHRGREARKEQRLVDELGGKPVHRDRALTRAAALGLSMFYE